MGTRIGWSCFERIDCSRPRREPIHDQVDIELSSAHRETGSFLHRPADDLRSTSSGFEAQALGSLRPRARRPLAMLPESQASLFGDDMEQV